MGVSVAWKSKAQKPMGLSLAESEYVAISELVKEVQFARQVLSDIGLTVTLPIPIFVDNNGAIEIVRNNRGVMGLRHVCVRFHYVQQLHGQDILVMLFRRCSENEADILTKNATRQEFEKHAPKLVVTVPSKLLANAKKKEGC